MTKDTLLQEINRFLEKLDITDLNQVYSYFKDLFSVNAESEERPVCPHCKSSLVIKHGFRHGKQCYRCKECKKTFVATKNTVMYYSHFGELTWMEFIKDTIEGRSLDYSANRLGFSHPTAFNMRQKLLLALETIRNLEPVTLSNISELDETFVLDSYKGSSVPEEAERGPRKHGARAQRPGISNEYICICAGVERNGGPAMALAVNRATPSKEELKEVFGEHIGAGTLLLTDGEKGYQSLRSVAEGCSVVSVKAQKGRAFHLNNVNAFHSLIKGYYEQYRGVATKYLNRYNALFSMVCHSLSGLKDRIFSRLSKVSSVCFWTPVLRIKLQGVLGL